MKDLPSTLWGYEASQEVMFVSDGFSLIDEQSEELGGSVHLPEECTMFLSELPRIPTVAEAAFLNRAALWWAHHRQFEPLMTQIRTLLDRYPTRLIAPAHGGVIDDVETFIPVMVGGFDIAYEIGARRSSTVVAGESAQSAAQS